MLFVADVSQQGDNQHLADLKTAIQSRKLVAIIGIGVSRQVAKPLVLDGFEVVTWLGLIGHGIQRCLTLGAIDQKEADNLTLMAGFDNVDHLIHVAETITRKLKGLSLGAYQKWLNETVGILEVGTPRLVEALVKITAFIASLNYDTLPEQVTQRASVSWNRPDRVSQIVNGKQVHAAGRDRDAILHPHGCWDDGDSVVLGTSSYREVTGNSHAQAIQLLFAVGHTMVFIGCGSTFDDPNFSQFIPAATAILKDTTMSHFVLCRTSEVESWKGKAAWLHPIAYGDKYEDLAPFLEGLAKYGGEPPPPEPAPAPAPPQPSAGPSFPAEWRRLTQKIDPGLLAELVTVGRKPAVDKLEQLAKGEQTELGLQTRYPSEIISFVAGFLEKIKWINTPEGDRWRIIRNRDEWEKAAQAKEPKSILVAEPNLEFESDRTKLTQAANANGHAVVYATLLGRTDNKDVVPLSQPSLHDLTELLKKHGVPGAKAEKLVNRSNGNVPLLIRYLSGTADRPAWAKPETVGKLRPLALLGGWRTDIPPDIEAVGGIVGSDYHQWVSDLFPVLHGEEPPFVHNQNIFRPVSRYENWQILAPYLTNADLERFKQAAITALREDNPRFELPAEQRILSGLEKTKPKPSETLRQGLAETLTLLGSKPEALTQCSPHTAREVVFSVIHTVLNEADWKRWASLGSLVSLLAEADPETYLRIVTADLGRGNDSAIKQLFGEVEGGIFGGFYHSGVLWSLEVLAWKPELLNRVALILAELDQIPLPENLGNRPMNSLRTTLLPWLPQTLATVAERKTAVETVIRDFPDTGWKLLMELLPESHSSSSYNQRPLWRDWIPPERDEGTTNGERREQEKIYAELALTLALKHPDRLKELFEHMLYLPELSFAAITSAMKSEAVVGQPEKARLPLWQRMEQEIRRQRKYATAVWAVPAEVLKLLEEIARVIEPKAPEVRHQYLFNFEDHDFWETDDYQAEGRKVRARRGEAVRELLQKVGLTGVLDFAQEVVLPFYVGVALGDVGAKGSDTAILPRHLRAEGKLADLARGFVAACFEKLGLAWLDDLPIKTWSPEDTGVFFYHLPFRREVWEAAEEFLGDKATEYWRHVNVHPFGEPAEILAAAEKLLEFDRGPSALRAVYQLIQKNHPVSPDLALRAIKSFLRTYTKGAQHDLHTLREVIEYLQAAPATDPAELAQLEWNLLPLLDRHSGSSPVTLERNLAASPAFFVEVIKACYRGKGEPKPADAPVDAERKQKAENGYRLLRNWHIPPGVSKAGELDVAALESWIAEVRKLTEPSGHWEVAQTHIGQIMIHVPTDPSGLVIHRGAAKILDRRENDDMRRGYRIALFNARGARWVGGGKADREEQVIYEGRAKAANAAGFTNLAATLTSLAESYARDAEREEKRAGTED